MPLPAPTVSPKKSKVARDGYSADDAFTWFSQGGTLVWEGDYHQARQLLAAVAKRIDKRRKPKADDAALSPKDAFNRYRQAQSRRAELLNRLLVPVSPGYTVLLRRAPDIVEACQAAFEPLSHDALIPLRQILGALSAHEWRKKGVAIEGLSEPLHVHYGVFSPIRGEYLDLIRTTPLPQGAHRALDLGTGSGVIALLLAQRGIEHVDATDNNLVALACATENIQRQGLAGRIDVIANEGYPDNTYDLIVCNPPWLPGRPTSALETAVYDPDSQMLKWFLQGLRQHLGPNGEGWLVMSDLAEHLGLRAPGAIEQWATDAGLAVTAHHDTRPRHPKASDAHDALHAARAKEVTRLWRFRVA